MANRTVHFVNVTSSGTSETADLPNCEYDVHTILIKLIPDSWMLVVTFASADMLKKQN